MFSALDEKDPMTRDVDSVAWQVLLWNRLGRVIELLPRTQGYPGSASALKKAIFSTYLDLRSVGKGAEALAIITLGVRDGN